MTACVLIKALVMHAGDRAQNIVGDVAGAPQVSHDSEDDAEDGILQRDDEQRFCRYNEVIGEGRFKVVYRGFDETGGQDIAWGVISADQQHLDSESMQQLFEEAQRNTRLKHKNIIRCFKCWPSDGQINLITELFTSGNLRNFIQEHKQLGADALRKFSRQILEGLEYLHIQDPPIVHGDLRCDKIYVNGNEGTVKIGDLGLVTLLARRQSQWGPGSAYESISRHNEAAKQDPEYDVLAFGMCMLEMYTQEIIEPHATHDIEGLIAAVHDEWARSIMSFCFRTLESRPTVSWLLECFFSTNRPKATPSRPTTPPALLDTVYHPHMDLTSTAARRELRDQLNAHPDAHSNHTSPHPSFNNQHVELDHPVDLSAASAPDSPPLPPVRICQLKGEDYVFTVRQSKRANTAHIVYIQLTMTVVDDEGSGAGASRTIEFQHHVHEDTPEGIGEEMQEEYHISDTDRDLVTALIIESLAGTSGYATL
jgi:WNK lysine deficient protein kinase